MNKLEIEYEDEVSRYAIGQWINLLPIKGNYNNVLGFVSCTNISPYALSQQMKIPKWKEKCIDEAFLNMLKQLQIDGIKYMVSTIAGDNNPTESLLHLKSTSGNDMYLCLAMESIQNPKSITLIQDSEEIESYTYKKDYDGQIVLGEENKNLVRKRY